MKIATWNVNSLNVRLPQVLAWLACEQPDLLALQETKLLDERFPCAEIEAAGYHATYVGQKTYNGVAIFSRMPPENILLGIPGYEDPQRRALTASYKGIRLVNLYVPNGESVESEKFRYKLGWLEKVNAWLKLELADHAQLVVVGDFNIAPEPRDVHDPQRWDGHVLFSAPERAAFQSLLDLGLCDTFRLFEQPEKIFSWWDYRMQGFRRNHGLRIDHILASDALCQACGSCRVDKGPRAHERPSDHAPVVAEFHF